ncbi:MAG: S8 family serine peptidase [bacterium]|nr:S8 family serine peptidase [bacterium]
MNRVRSAIVSSLFVGALLATATPAAEPGPIEDAGGRVPLAVNNADAVRSVADDPRTLRTTGRIFDPLVAVPPMNRAHGLGVSRERPDAKRVLLVQFAETVTAADRTWLAGHGFEPLRYVPGRAVLARGRARGVEALRADPRVRWLGDFRPDDKLDAGWLEAEFEGVVRLEVALLPGARLERLHDVAPSARVESVDSQPWGDVMRLRVDGAEARAAAVALANDADVERVLEWRDAVPHNDDSAYVVQSYDLTNRTNYALSAPVWNQGILGTGQVVAVVDTGFDVDLCFFKYGLSDYTLPQSPVPPDPGTLEPSKKVVGYAVLPGAHAEGTTDHGSHVATTIAGDSFATPSTPTSPGHDAGDGMAPQAQLYFQDGATISGGFLAGTVPPADLSGQAFAAGARIQSNSWGAQFGSEIAPYNHAAQARDLFTWHNEEFLHVFSMGNIGGLNGNQFVASPAVAKNVLAVGATTHGSSPSDAASVASFSAVGPASDGRVRPDIAAPGEDVLSAAGNTLFGDNTCTLKLISGTSMAAPTAAGSATLVRQYFTDGFWPAGAAAASDALTPSAALIKAMLINGADDVATADIPNGSEGWGRIHLDDALQFAGDAESLRVWDRRNADGLVTGEQDDVVLDVVAGRPLRVTLVWTDPPAALAAAAHLVNDLDLEVIGPGGTRLGNVLVNGESTTGGSRDATNNVEQVLLSSPASGSYTVRVKATSVPGNVFTLDSDRQGYALVATYGACAAASPAAPQAASASANATAGIDLSWNPVAGATGYRVDRAPGTCAAPQGSFTFLDESVTTSLTDARAQGGYAHAYRIRSLDACGVSAAVCVDATATGTCTLPPAFDGVRVVDNATATAACDLELQWDAAVSRCPAAPTVVYNVYRGVDPYFAPAPGNRVATGVGGTAWTDPAVDPLRTYYYVVRAEDGTTGNGGPGNGGNEETNLALALGTASGDGSRPATWTDDGGDTNAKLILDPPWRVTDRENHTPGGGLSYRNARDEAIHSNNVCAAATTPPIELQPGSPQLTYMAKYDLEWNWDGVVVEVSADDGLTWHDLAPNDIAGQAAWYPGAFVGSGTGSRDACGYPRTQGHISNPNVFGGLIGWAKYTHELGAWAGRTVRIRWNFSSDSSLEYEGLYLDDIRVTHAGEPQACGGGGLVRFDRAVYGCADTLTLTLHDADHAGAGSLPLGSAVVLSDTEALPEGVALVETAPGSGIFEATLATTTLAPTGGDGAISVADGDRLLARGTDAEEDAARVDCSAPAITGVRAVEVTHDSARILWNTDERASSRVDYGTPSPSATASDATSHAQHDVRLDGLTPCTTYVFRVESTDEAGNTLVADNAGQLYSFTTAMDSAVVVAATDTPLGIPDLDPSTGATSTIVLADGRAIVDLDVEVDITHPNAWEPTLTLIAPDSTEVQLSGQGGVVIGGQDYSDTLFDDEALVSIDSAAAPFTGAWRPEDPLSTLDGKPLVGTWSLNVVDGINIPAAPPNVGQLDGWTLRAVASPEWCVDHGSYAGHASTADSCAAGGAGDQDGFWDPGESVTFDLTLRNDGTGTLTGVSAVVTPLTGGVEMTGSGTSFGTLAPGGEATGGGYAARLSSAFNCWSTVTFLVDVISDQGQWSRVFTQPIGDPTTATCQLNACNRPGPVPDGTTGTALAAARGDAAGSTIDLIWDVSGCAADDYEVLYGALDSVADYEVDGSDCALGTAGSHTWSAVPPGSLWFVVVGQSPGGTEGSWGFDSTGSHRAAARPSGACGNFARDDNTVCP